MSGEAKQETRETFIPAPTGGLNLISPPTQLAPNEARQLDNYWVYDWGIRERSTASTIGSPLYISANYYPALFGVAISSEDYPDAILVYFDKGSGTVDCSIWTGSAWSPDLSALGQGYAFNAFTFNKHVFIPNPVIDTIDRYSLETDTYAESSFTGATDAIYGFVFKNRPYFIDANSSVVRYGGVGAITGSLSSGTDIGEFFQKGRFLTWGASWSFNQGNINEDLFVVGNEQGEVFVYSGDYPDADNWTLVTRVVIPRPVARAYDNSFTVAGDYALPPGIVNTGQDLLITTERGVISLAKIIAGRRDERYYLASRKLGGISLTSTPDISAKTPFMYFGDGTNVYVMNYETGAFSRFTDILSDNNAGGSIHQIVCSGDYVYFLVSGTVGGVYRLNESLRFGATVPNVWKTDHLDYGRQTQKKHVGTKLIGRVTGGTTLSASVGISNDFQTAGLTSTNSRTGDGVLELSPPGLGVWHSHEFSKTGSASHQNELVGARVIYNDGGMK